MIKYLLLFLTIIGTLGAKTSEAQVFPSDTLTRSFYRNLDDIVAANNGAFVSTCYNPKNDQMAILLIPVGGDEGTLTLFAKRKAYNGAGISLEEGKVKITEGGGGEWSLSELQFFAQYLVNSKFALKWSVRLRSVASETPSYTCPIFEGPQKLHNSG